MQQTTSIWVSKVSIHSFRSITDLTVNLERDVTYLVGENNTGKSTILAAISIALGSTRGNNDDLLRVNQKVLGEPAVIDVFISPTSSTFSDVERQRFGGNAHTDTATGMEFVAIRTVLKPSREGGPLISERCFLQPGAGEELLASPTPFIPAALSLFHCELLDASRDLLNELGSKSSRWGRTLFDLQIPDNESDTAGGEAPASNASGRSGLEGSLALLAQQMRESSPVLQSLENQLTRIKEVQSSVGNVILQPFPPTIEEVMRSIDILIGDPTGQDLPIRFHGMGSRSLASLFVFSALCHLRLGADSAVVPHLLTLIEEPEAHLHPQAVSALRLELEQLPGQRIVSTHSPQLISDVEPGAMRLIRRSKSGVTVGQISTATLEGTARFRRFVQRPFGELFFARLVVFGDGATERDALPVLLRHALNRSIESIGVSVVDCESMDHPQIPKLVAAVSEMGIPWIVFADNDDSGEKALAKIWDPINSEFLSAASPRVVVAGAKAMEQLLIDAEYSSEIIDVANEHGETFDETTTARDLLKYLAENKGWVGQIIAKKAVENGKSVPGSVRKLADKITETLGLEVSDDGEANTR